jgi:hypothetical protein
VRGKKRRIDLLLFGYISRERERESNLKYSVVVVVVVDITEMTKKRKEEKKNRVNTY